MKINLTASLVNSTHRYYKDTTMHTYLYIEGWVGPSSFPPLPNSNARGTPHPLPPSKHLGDVLFYERANAI